MGIKKYIFLETQDKAFNSEWIGKNSKYYFFYQDPKLLSAGIIIFNNGITQSIKLNNISHNINFLFKEKLKIITIEEK